jgi:hypothetical protein
VVLRPRLSDGFAFVSARIVATGSKSSQRVVAGRRNHSVEKLFSMVAANTVRVVTRRRSFVRFLDASARLSSRHKACRHFLHSSLGTATLGTHLIDEKAACELGSLLACHPVRALASLLDAQGRHKQKERRNRIRSSAKSTDRIRLS